MAEIPEQLLAYFAEREQQRAAAVDTFLDSLTDYERGLVHDVAVMGYVRGSLHPRGEEIPLNRAIVADIVNACFVHSDLYPTVNAEYKEASATVEYFVQRQQPDGSWSQASSTTTDPKAAVEQREAQHLARPDFAFRLARRTTRVIVETERTPEEA